MPETRRHTKRDLVRLFKDRGLRANRLLGQHFLVDHNVLDVLCRAAELSPDDTVLEIGAGTGLLTEHLARTGARVVAVEIDPNLFAIASEYIGDSENVRLLCSDIHGTRRRIHPDVEAELNRQLTDASPLKVVSNLPYCISSDLIVSLLELPRPVERMVLTAQAEFARRLLAGPGTRDYSALTVLLHAQTDVNRIRDLAPSVFWPVPSVGSSVVHVVRDRSRRSAIADYRLLKSVVSALFRHRRKTASNALASLRRPGLSRDRLAAAFRAAGIDPDARGDALDVADIVALANQLAAT